MKDMGSSRKKTRRSNEVKNVDIKTDIGKLIKKFNNQKKSDKKRSVVAFDIGTTTIKIVEGIYHKQRLSIDKCIQIQTPTDSIDDGIIKIKDALVSTLKRVLKENRIIAKDGICTTRSTSIINREILIPVVGEDEMETVVRFEIQQYLPINLDECIIQTTVLNKIQDIDGRDKLNVRVIAYPKKVALEYYKLLNDLNLKPYVLDLNFNALNKLVNITNMIDKFEYNGQSSVAFLDIGANFIDVNIYKGEKLDFTRTIKAGGKDIDEILIQDGGFEIEMLQKVKVEQVNLMENELTMNLETTLAKSVIDEWIEKIEMILQFYRNSNIENSIESIIIFGGVSKLKGLKDYMESRIGTNVKKVKGVSNIAFKQIEDNGETLCDFMNVIGSVIRL